MSSPSFASWIIDNQVRERILGCVLDGEEPNRGCMNVMYLSSNADRLKGSEAADTRPLVVLERVVGAVDVPSAFAVASVWTTGVGVLSTVGSAKRSCPEAAASSPKRSSISTLAFFLCTIYCPTVNLWFLFLFLFFFCTKKLRTDWCEMDGASPWKRWTARKTFEVINLMLQKKASHSFQPWAYM